MLRFVHAPIFTFPYGTLPDVVESIDLWPSPQIPSTVFYRTMSEEMPRGYQSTEPIVAHYREDTPRFARRLLVFGNGCCMVPWMDEYNPDAGYEVQYLATDANGDLHGESEGDVRYPYTSQPASSVSEAEYEEVRLPAVIITPTPEQRAVNIVGNTHIIGGSPTGLAWGKMAPSRAFLEKVVLIADEVGTDPSFLLTQFWGESGFNPQAHLNSSKGAMKSSVDPTTIGKSTIGGGLFGLMRQWAKPAVGVAFDDFMHMDALEQLDYARKFYLGAKGKLKTMNDVFIYTFYPAALGKKDSYVIARKGEPTYDQNKHFDTNKDGDITKGEAAATRYKMYLTGMKDGNRLDLGDLATFAGHVGDITSSFDPRVAAPANTQMAVAATASNAIGSVRLPDSIPRMKPSSLRICAVTQVKLMLQDILDLCCQDLVAQGKEANGLSKEGKKLLKRMDARLVDDSTLVKLQLAETYYLSVMQRSGSEASYLATLRKIASALAAKKKRTITDVLFLFGLDRVIEQQDMMGAPSAVDVDELLDEGEEDYADKLDEWIEVLGNVLVKK